ncbi:EcsC family protein [Bacillus sp. V3]|uniref:EcsC family protein n=1 Tax=[Bacillus] enclensis TaxID=1402860 RepID=UPI0018D44CA4|nr:EcsC family protein [[Bacillus] enclensis]MBH9965181.1 EcsC family protein [[Bacillus] enclensis]QTC42663.1 EcsC family protein [Bacillus sp. V3]
MIQNETKEYLLQELETVAKWEKDQKGLWFWEKIGRVPFMILDRITPKMVHKKLGQALDEIGSYIQKGGSYLTSEKEVLNRIKKQTGNEEMGIHAVKEMPLQVMDDVSQAIVETRKKVAMTQGATTGIGGFLTLSIDIPFILGISLKTLQEIALSYGYDPNEPSERVFIIKCLQFVSSDVVGKQAILQELSEFNQASPNKRDQAISQLQGWREVMVSFRDNFGWKKLFQMIPIAGILFGSFINKSMMHDIGEAGRMLYRKRRILEKLEIQV